MCIAVTYRIMDEEVDLVFRVYQSSEFDKELFQEGCRLFDKDTDDDRWEILGLKEQLMRLTNSPADKSVQCWTTSSTHWFTNRFWIRWNWIENLLGAAPIRTLKKINIAEIFKIWTGSVELAEQGQTLKS